jgi:very-short-patch-repair endonuclease
VPQYEVLVDGLELHVDLAFPEARLAVEYEGAYHFEETQIVRDDARYALLVAAGWRVLRLSSADLRDLDGVIRRIQHELARAL